MAFNRGICTHCSTAMNVDVLEEITLCLTCHSPFVTGEGINLYNSNLFIGDYNPQSRNVKPNSAMENLLLAAEKSYTDLKGYIESAEIFKEAIRIDPSDYRARWGLARVLSDDFTCFTNTDEIFNHIQNNAEMAIKLVEATYKDSLIEVWTNYKNSRSNALKNLSANKP